MTLRTLIAGVLIGVTAFAADTGAELFQKARTQETAAGNLEEAIRLYQRVATEFASDRALTAKSLVAEAQCYEKLGQDKAVKLYEQVARDYRDQRASVATANARLAALRQGQHAVAPVEARTAAAYTPDGNWFVYHDGHVGMATDGLFRVATSGGQPERIGDYPPENLSGLMWISPDGKQIIADTSNPEDLWVLENFEPNQQAAK